VNGIILVVGCVCVCVCVCVYAYGIVDGFSGSLTEMPLHPAWNIINTSKVDGAAINM
jgi:hypothetical protein